MNKSIYILLISLFVIASACNNKRDMEGIWVTSYDVDNSKEWIGHSMTATLLDFSGDSLFIKYFDQSRIIRSMGYTYKIDGNHLMVGNESVIIKNLNQDTLVLLSINKEDTIKNVLIRMKIMPSSSELSFAQRAFVIKGEDIVDSLDFINDSMVLELCERRISRYFIYKYKGLNILVLAGSLNPPLYISQNSETSFNLTLYDRHNSSLKMTEIEDANDISVIYGDWTWPTNKENEETHIPPPPPWSDDPHIHLTFNKDSIIINRYGQKRTLEWEMNSTNEFVLFPGYLEQGVKPWKIIKVDSNELVIVGGIIPFSRLNSEDTLTFKRQ